MQSKFGMAVPFGAKEVLLHACCAPCSAAIVECLLSHGVRPTLFYYNPNIYPEREYNKRKAECIRHAQLLGLPFVDADRDHDQWLEAVKGLEGEPERGARCLTCFGQRLMATATYAHEKGYKVFATTLAASRWKNLGQIKEAGEAVAGLFPNLVFWAQNWRKGGLSERRNALIARYGFYNQSYCGCEFSQNQLRTADYELRE